MAKLAGIVVSLFAVVSFASEPKIIDYVPGQKGLTWNEYHSLARAFSNARSKDTSESVEEKNALYNEKVEDEALHSLLRVLSDPSARVYYAGFQDYDSSIDKDGEIQTKDGLFGFKVVRQIEVLDKEKKPRLISAIFSYQFDAATKTFRLRAGADVVRVRFEVEPFQLTRVKDSNRLVGKGMAAFSWAAEASSQGKITKIHSALYVKNYPGPLNLSDPNYDQKRRGFAFKPYTPCSLPDHCMACHHSDTRTVFTPEVFNEFRKSPLDSKAVAEFISYARQNLNLPESDIRDLLALLKDSNKAFPAEDIATLVSHRMTKK
jgi:hypothetical protein